MKRRLIAPAAVLLLASCSSDPQGPQTVSVSADLQAAPSTGTAITDFVLDASGSTASTRRGMEFRWDWNDDGHWDTGWSGEAVVVRRFGEDPNPHVRVEARQDGFSDQAVAVLSVDLDHGEQVGQLRVLDLIEPVDMCWDGSHFWILGSLGGGETRIHRVGLDGLVAASLGTPLSRTRGIAFDGEHLWVSDNPPTGEQTLVFEIDPATGLNLRSFEAAYAGLPAGLDYRDGVFYHGSSPGNSAGDERIHRYDAEGLGRGAFDAPAGSAGPRALACDGEVLWVLGHGIDTVFALNAGTGALLRSLEIPGHEEAVAVVNGYLWLPFIETVDEQETLFLRKFVP